MVQDNESVESQEASGESAAAGTASSGGRQSGRDHAASGRADGEAGGRRYSQLSERSRCRFTRAKVERIDYKDIGTLQKLVTPQGKIQSRKRTGTAAKYQRMVKRAVKRARFMALLPYTGYRR